jgi:hypothetical protein
MGQIQVGWTKNLIYEKIVSSEKLHPHPHLRVKFQTRTRPVLGARWVPIGFVNRSAQSSLGCQNELDWTKCTITTIVFNHKFITNNYTITIHKFILN